MSTPATQQLDLLFNVFSFLTLKDLCRTKQVCRSWKTVAQSVQNLNMFKMLNQWGREEEHKSLKDSTLTLQIPVRQSAHTYSPISFLTFLQGRSDLGGESFILDESLTLLIQHEMVMEDSNSGKLTKDLHIIRLSLLGPRIAALFVGKMTSLIKTEEGLNYVISQVLNHSKDKHLPYLLCYLSHPHLEEVMQSFWLTVLQKLYSLTPLPRGSEDFFHSFLEHYHPKNTVLAVSLLENLARLFAINQSHMEELCYRYLEKAFFKYLNQIEKALENKENVSFREAWHTYQSTLKKLNDYDSKTVSSQRSWERMKTISKEYPRFCDRLSYKTR